MKSWMCLLEISLVQNQMLISVCEGTNLDSKKSFF